MFIFVLCFPGILLCSVNLKCVTDDKGMSMQSHNCEVYSLFILMLRQQGCKLDNITPLQPVFEATLAVCSHFQVSPLDLHNHGCKMLFALS